LFPTLTAILFHLLQAEFRFIMPFTPHVRLKRVAEIGESRAMTNASHRESLLIKTARSMPDRIGWERIINGGRTAATTFSGSAQKKT